MVDRLPTVDLDPATNPRSLVAAKRRIVWQHGEDARRWIDLGLDTPRFTKGGTRWELGDGLAMPWNGSIFLNGPYSDMLPFADKANEEWGASRLKEAIFLVKLDPTTKWWRALMSSPGQKSIELWLFNSRLQHVPPPRIKASTNNFASAIIHWRRPINLTGHAEMTPRPSLSLGDIATKFTQAGTEFLQLAPNRPTRRSSMTLSRIASCRE